LNVVSIWIDPWHDLAMALTINLGGEEAQQALFALAAELYKKIPPKQSPSLKSAAAWPDSASASVFLRDYGTPLSHFEATSRCV
jgi:hypothetical protein